MSAPQSRKGGKDKAKKSVSRGQNRKAKTAVTKKTEMKGTSKKKAGPRKAPRGKGEVSKAAKGAGTAECPPQPRKAVNPVPESFPETTHSRRPRTREDLRARKEEEIGLMLRLLQEAKTKESRRRITILSRRRRS